MLRHVIAPLRHFSQISNEILRHPRLSSDAVRILTWQLSLPPGAAESLSRTATRAGIGKGAFNRAKAQLKGEGFVHEWRQQGLRGLWSTVQLVSSVPLTAEEALAVRNGRPTAAERTEHPTAACPAAGEPKGRGAGRHPEKTTVGNTSTPPPPPPPPADSGSEPGSESECEPERDREARELVDSITALDPRLTVPRGMVPQLVALASEWLSLGHTADDVRGQVRRGLPGRERAIHRPGGLLRYLLSEPGPVTPPTAPSATPAPPPPRLPAMRECAGPRHMQPMLFTPEGDEELCAVCRDASPLQESAAVAATARGAAAVRAGLAGRRTAARH
ncbi:hypothetical protein [Streptomyces sp. ML-6]|uniref:hypothetical protein n=1 Tax=Streptomyces sp. ML-6 TaxID=2982693 RepID=UPI0024BF44BF|nr:hypothetical protein [Streptomyces sp. ML-6]MDK0522000.1 hypothetical protein [Streptomyces sp. ML-6]